MVQATRRRLSPLLATVLAAAAMALIFFVGRASALPQPNMEAALGHLEQARTALERADHDKGGHRQKALELTVQAIAAVREGIASGNK